MQGLDPEALVAGIGRQTAHGNAGAGAAESVRHLKTDPARAACHED